jgi:DNA-binding transcriptional MerR regulator
MKRGQKLLVKEVAAMAGVSVRALHHYDDIGLLAPRARSTSGYRLYDEGDLLRLQQILIGRELGLSLEEIRRSLDDPRFDRRAALLSQRAQLEERSRQTGRMIAAIDAALVLLDAPEPKEEEAMDMKSIFDGFDPSQYEAEAKQRWGQTDAYKTSQTRAKSYRKEDWEQIKTEQDAIYADLAAAMTTGKPASGQEAMDVAERHRLSIDRWFYPCSQAMHVGLADMYESDERFAANIDKYGAGLTAYFAEAIRANAKRLT